MTRDLARLMSVLTHVQAHPELDLSLPRLSARAKLSPSRFHAVFTDALGETPRRHVERIRLEWTAFRLIVHDVSILRLALDAGYRNPETFSRAFRRRFGCTPREYRTTTRHRIAADREAMHTSPDLPVSRNNIGPTRVITLRPLHLATIRHIGPYEDVPESLFDQLDAWATKRRMRSERIWMGFGHDAPVTTAPAQLRFDAALVVEAPFASASVVQYRHFDGGSFAVTRHIGPFDALPSAYPRVFQQLRSLRGYEIAGLPVVEVYRTPAIRLAASLAETDICLPVRRSAGPRVRRGRSGSGSGWPPENGDA